MKKGLEAWVEIFRAGTQTDSKGNTREFSQADLDQIITNHCNPVPHVITHDELYSPFAYAQAHELKREGDVLFAKSQNIQSDFEALIQDGRLYERSVRLVPAETGWQLAHIAWLGAEPPAVQGLAPVEFSVSTQVADFSYIDTDTPSTLKQLMRNVREFIVDKFDLDTANRVVPEWQIESAEYHERHVRERAESDLTPSNDFQAGANTVTTYTQEQLDAAKAEAEASAKATAHAEYQAQMKEERDQRFKAEFKADIDAAISAGRLTPAQAEGMTDFAASLPEEVMDFSAADGKTLKKSPREWFADFMASLPKQVPTSTQEGHQDQGVDTQDAEALGKAAAEYQASQKQKGIHVSTAQAVAHIVNQGAN